MLEPTITVDIGTTSIKLCLFDEVAEVVASARLDTPTTTDECGEIYDVPRLRAAVDDFMAALGPQRRATVRRISITGVGESGGLVRADTSLASPMILWYDHRGAGFIDALEATDRSRIYRVTGLPVNANYGLSKAAWAVSRDANAAPDAQWLNVAEYLAATLTGDRWSEPSLASRTMALDLASREWSHEIAQSVGLRTATFPPLREARDGREISGVVAERVGLASDVRVHVAGHDHMVGGVGAGLQDGELLDSTGTTEGLLVLQPRPSLDGAAETAKLANGLACAGDGFTLFASIPTGGSAFATLQDMLGIAPGALATAVDELHARYLDHEIDLDRMPLVLPRFRGSPPPTKDGSARGAIAGLRTDTTLDELVFATFLGMARQFRDVLELFPAQPSRVKLIGPASRNPLWTQLKADLLGITISSSTADEVVSRGAQALACGVTGTWDDLSPVAFEPDRAWHARLGEWSTATAPIWAHLKDTPS